LIVGPAGSKAALLTLAERKTRKLITRKIPNKKKSSVPRVINGIERGINENINRIIRRFIAKGRKIEKLTQSTIQTIENWINNYPRKILNFQSAQQGFERKLQEIAA